MKTRLGWLLVGTTILLCPDGAGASWKARFSSFPWSRRAMAIQYTSRLRDQELCFVICPLRGAIKVNSPFPNRAVSALFRLESDGMVLRYRRPSLWNALSSVDHLLDELYWNIARSNAAELVYGHEVYLHDPIYRGDPALHARPDFLEARVSPIGLVRSVLGHRSDLIRGGTLVEGFEIHRLGYAQVLVRLGQRRWSIAEQVGVRSSAQEEMLSRLPEALFPYGGMSPEAGRNRGLVYAESVRAQLTDPRVENAGWRRGVLPRYFE